MKISENDLAQILRKIRCDLRLSMDGVVSTSMRQKGVDYSLNFGVSIPNLRKIAQRYPRDRTLALELWSKNVRELKILGTLLFPVERCSEEIAEKMATEIPNQEMREQLCMNLLQRVDFAHRLVQKWTVASDNDLRTTGYWLFARLSIAQSALLQHIDARELMHKAIADVCVADLFLQNAALLSLKHIGRHFPATKSDILASFADNPLVRDALRFEFEYYA